MGLFAGTPPVDSLGIADGRLKPVREQYWNAVSSFAQTDYHRIEPLAAGPDPRAAFAVLERLLLAEPGVSIVTARSPYLHAEFSTRWLGFVDDVEFLLDEPGRVIHVRSASRLGRKDFGVNRKRVETLRARLAAELAPTSSTGSPPSSKDGGTPSPSSALDQSTERKSMSTTLPSGLQIDDVVVGNGDEATAGRNVKVHYTGWLYKNGTVGAKFDSSKDRGQPFVVPARRRTRDPRLGRRRRRHEGRRHAQADHSTGTRLRRAGRGRRDPGQRDAAVRGGAARRLTPRRLSAEARGLRPYNARFDNTGPAR